MAFGVLAASCEPNPCAPVACPAGPPSRVGIFTPLFTNLTDANYVNTEARALGVQTVRATQAVDSSTLRSAFNQFTAKGLRFVMTAVNDQQPDGTGNNPAHPPVTADEIATYQARLGTILDSGAAPVVLMVENEENAANFFAGTMEQYRGELDAAIEVAHARNIQVTDGAITSDPLALLTWQDYKDRGLDAQADDFASRAFANKPGVLADLRKVPFAGLTNRGLQTAWEKAKELVPLLAGSRVDFVDFHWYIDDDQALKEAVDFLQRATGKPAITTEIGQHNTSASVVTGHLGKVVQALHLPLVLWFDWDGIPALGLHTPGSPGVLRDNGTAFKNYVNNHRDSVT
jgi:hypothetical protein